MLRQICSVRRSLTPDALLTLLRALVITKLDCCCSTLAGVSGTLLQRLQSVLNAAARLVYSARRSEHTTPLLRQLHWLKVSERIKFRLYVLVHRCLHNKSPPYLAEKLHLTTEIDARRRLRLASRQLLCRQPAGSRSTSGSGVCLKLSVPLSDRTVSSLNAFRDDLKTVLFRASFDDRT